MDFIAALVLMLGGDSGSPVDRVLPEAVSVRVRMLALREGMSEPEVVRRLGLKDRDRECCLGFTAARMTIYRVGRTYRLTLWFGELTARTGLGSATLEPEPDK